MSPRRTKSMLLALSGAMALALSACGTGDLEQNALDPEGPIARQLDRLWDPVFAIAAAIFFLVNFLVIFVVVKYRARSDDDAPVQVHGNVKLEIFWTIVPALILAFVGVFTVATIFDINRRANAGEVLEVEVIGHQWWWEYKYQSLDIVTANELVIPAGERVQLKLGSVDVMHNYWPPKLAGKVYAIPGRTNYMQVEADDPGTYWGQCAEYCGLSHGYMRLKVVAYDQADWDDWVARNQRPAPAANNQQEIAGAELFISKGCNTCHRIDGLEGADGEVGPDLTHLYSRKTFAGASFELDERNLRRWLRDPPAMKPMVPENNQGMPNLGLTEDEITDLIAYLETLK